MAAKVLRKSGREDLNLRPPAPKAGALARLRYAPKVENNLSKVAESSGLLQRGV